MSAVKVQQILRRYHLKPSERDLQPRLNQLTETVLREQLGSVLTESGIGSSELVCIKELHLAMYYGNDKSDFEISELWRETLLKSIYQQLDKGSNRFDLIRYPSKIEAIKSVARSLSIGQLDHQWAWWQLGITSSKNAELPRVKEQWLAYLRKDPQRLLPVLRGLIAEGTFIQLLERNVLRPDELIKLTGIVTKFLNLEINWVGIIEQHDELNDNVVALKNVRVSGGKYPLSDFTRALLRSFQSIPEFAYGSAQSEPTMSIQTDLKTAFIKLLFWSLFQPGKNELNVASSTTKAIETELLQLWRAVDKELLSFAKPRNTEFSSSDNFNSSTHQNVRLDPKVTGDKQFYSDEELISGHPINKQSVFSRFGGLLFLLNKLEQEDILQRLQHPLLTKHSMSWRLENFCWLLLPECKGDESVKVFSGQVFNTAQNEDIAEMICEEEEQLLIDIAEEFKREIVSTLSLYSRSKNTVKSDLFADMCRRKVRIEAQPGWVNVFYELDSVDTTVRAAGFDLNPDYLPWLAYVVKFYYE
jgi:hypothetical protein